MGWPRVTIGQMMALILIVALALAPLPYAMRSPTKESIVATGAYEIIFLPVVSSLIALAVMEPGAARIRLIVVLSLSPMIVVGVSGALLYVLGLFRVASNPGGLIRLLQNPALWFWFILYPALLAWRHRIWRCPSCGAPGRSLQPLSRHIPEKRLWVLTGELKCGRCGRRCRFRHSWGFPGRLKDSEQEPPA